MIIESHRERWFRMNLPERITDAEERIRDRALKPILDLLIPDWVYPNHITGLRIVLVSTAIIFI